MDRLVFMDKLHAVVEGNDLAHEYCLATRYGIVRCARVIFESDLTDGRELPEARPNLNEYYAGPMNTELVQKRLAELSIGTETVHQLPI